MSFEDCELYCVCLDVVLVFFFFKQKTAYEMRISDWSSDVCSSDLWRRAQGGASFRGHGTAGAGRPVPGRAGRADLRSHAVAGLAAGRRRGKPAGTPDRKSVV